MLTSTTTSTVEWSDDLRRGIWPRSASLWVIAFWTALLIVRPWEKMFPWMTAIRFEFLYSAFAVIVLGLGGRFRLIASMQTAAVVLWFVALTISSSFAVEPAIAWNQLYLYVTVLLFFFALIAVIRTPYQLLFVVCCYVASTVLFLAKSQVEYFVFGGEQFTMGVKRLQGDNGTYGHPNSVAALAVICLPFVLFLWQARGEFTRTWPSSWRRAFTWALGLSFVVSVSSIIMTNSRTGLVALGGFVLLIALRKQSLSRILRSVAVGLALMGVMWMIVPESNRHRMKTMWAPTEGDVDDESAVGSAHGRKVGFEIGMEMFRRFPVTGVGLGNYVYYRKLNLDGGNLIAHNTYAAVLGETGIIGGAAFLFFIAGIFINARRTNRLAKLVVDPTVQLLARLTAACRQATVLFLFVAIAGDYQAFAPLYWIPAYCLLAWKLALTVVQQLEAQAFADWSD